MISLLGALLGFIGSLVPEVFKIFRDKEDRQHELKIMQLQIEMQKSGNQERLEEIKIGADSAIMSEVYKTYYSGVKWVDALNGTVRPILSYAFFFLYSYIKISAVSSIESIGWVNILMLWGEEDQAIFSGIITFYFGSRALNKYRRSYDN